MKMEGARNHNSNKNSKKRIRRYKFDDKDGINNRNKRY